LAIPNLIKNVRKSNPRIIGTNFYDCWWADGTGGAVPKVKHPGGSRVREGIQF